MNLQIILPALILLSSPIFSQIIQADYSQPDSQAPVSNCFACRSLAESFEKGLKNTQRGKFEGGDANWEQTRLKNYADSELRLIEIQENLCNDVQNGKSQCLALLENHEEEIENWWNKERKSEITLSEHLCAKKYCCEKGFFGSDCSKCAECKGHGKCDGDGTKEGNGTCICDQGYTGIECESCESGFQLNSQLLTCEDVNECEMNDSLCPEQAYCQNIPGSFSCQPCDSSCNKCSSGKASDCIDCTEGYVKENNRCIRLEKSERQILRKEQLKYLLYVSITILSCILMRKVPTVSILLVVFLSIFIGIYEYAERYSLNSLTEAYEQLFY